jgi:replicative DNA helicase
MELSDIRRIPHSVEAEQSVIGSLLIDPACINQIADKLTAEHFYVEKYAKIYGIIFNMFLDNKTPADIEAALGVKTEFYPNDGYQLAQKLLGTEF